VAGDFQPFRLNDLEMVAEIFTSWNRTTDWLKRLDGVGWLDDEGDAPKTSSLLPAAVIIICLPFDDGPPRLAVALSPIPVTRTTPASPAAGTHDGRERVQDDRSLRDY
jgi:hypothetical protein